MRFGWNEGEGSKIREERKEEGGMTFRRSMIFKLSAPAYDARVKSFGVDFRGELEKKGSWNAWRMRPDEQPPRRNESNAPSRCRTYIRLTRLARAIRNADYSRRKGKIRILRVVEKKKKINKSKETSSLVASGRETSTARILQIPVLLLDKYKEGYRIMMKRWYSLLFFQFELYKILIKKFLNNLKIDTFLI